jgi:hypothetical protein
MMLQSVRSAHRYGRGSNVRAMVRPEGRDAIGHRRLSPLESAIWYAIAAVTYVAASIAEKGLLNWIVGPLWLVAVVTFGPALVDRTRRR